MIAQQLNDLIQSTVSPLLKQITAAKKEFLPGSFEYGLYQHAGNALICTVMGLQAQCELHDSIVAKKEADKPSEIIT